MKKETCLGIILMVVLIFLCVYVGTTKIMEGAATISSANNSALYISEEEDLTEASGILNAKKDKNTNLQKDSIRNQSNIKTNIEMTNDLRNKSELKKNEASELLQNAISNSIVPSAIYLPLYTDAKNESYGKLSSNDNTNMTLDAGLDIVDRTKSTNPSFTTLNGQKCIKFLPDNDSYLSFPFTNPDKFSFSFWIYVDTTDNTPYVVASITNYRNITKTNYNCSLEVGVRGSALSVHGALPSNNPWSIVHSYNGLTNGWTFIAFTYDSDFNTKLYVNNNSNPVSDKKGNGKFMANDIISSPNYFILGKSGCSWGGSHKYRGYMRDFYFYALTLKPEEVLEMYCKNNNINDSKCNQTKF